MGAGAGVGVSVTRVAHNDHSHCCLILQSHLASAYTPTPTPTPTATMPHYTLFGNPISHSLSPQLHALFAAQFNTTIDYQTHLTPLNAFKETVDAFRRQGGLGANITLPFKKEAFAYADTLTDRAKITGAVNTFIFKDTQCMGDNTDGIGFIRDIKISLREKHILIIGAGGAARGILGEIIRENPASITLINRTIKNAQDLMLFFKPYFPITLFSHEKKFDLIINAATLNFKTDFPIALDLSHTICYDLNYGQRANSFLQWARSHNAKQTRDGLGMLIEQGAESFYQWFGKRPETSDVIAQGFSRLNIPVL